jgi:hypothetical protein
MYSCGTLETQKKCFTVFMKKNYVIVIRVLSAVWDVQNPKRRNSTFPEKCFLGVAYPKKTNHPIST